MVLAIMTSLGGFDVQGVMDDADEMLRLTTEDVKTLAEQNLQ